MKEQDNITPVEQYVIDCVTQLRKDKKLGQEDFAAIIGVGRSFISHAENPNISAKYNIRHINALADYFGISPREFLPEKAFPVDGVVEKMVKKAPAKKAPARKPKAPAKKVNKK